ncbi:MAG: UbiX family flavin prenyltransferase [Candidatus Thalassarchaeaceae archaeon]|nr:UbiX family flavin prenyltransferase [Candidatus Thalassarchaeaceae archaeon]
MGLHIVAISGASGARYGVRLIEALRRSGEDVRLIVSKEGAINLELECSITPQELAQNNGCILEDNQNLAAKSASGSATIDSVVVCPASGTSISKIAAGISDNLVTRSAIVALKERRTLILVPREAPYATIHLENMTKISQWGGVVIPASPGFYNKPESIDDLIDFVVARILDQLGIENNLTARWTGEEIESNE